jgi:hypothetical protein
MTPPGRLQPLETIAIQMRMPPNNGLQDDALRAARA